MIVHFAQGLSDPLSGNGGPLRHRNNAVNAHKFHTKHVLHGCKVKTAGLKANYVPTGSELEQLGRRKFGAILDGGVG
jgi:hypothetical protein